MLTLSYVCIGQHLAYTYLSVTVTVTVTVAIMMGVTMTTENQRKMSGFLSYRGAVDSRVR